MIRELIHLQKRIGGQVRKVAGKFGQFVIVREIGRRRAEITWDGSFECYRLKLTANGTESPDEIISTARFVRRRLDEYFHAEIEAAHRVGAGDCHF